MKQRRDDGQRGIGPRRWAWLVALLLLCTSGLSAQEKGRSSAADPKWRPAASELLESVTAGRYRTREILAKRPGDFDEKKLDEYRTLVLAKHFRNIDQEFLCKYELYRYALARLTTTTDDPSVERVFRRRYHGLQDLCRRLYRRHAFSSDEQERQAECVKDPYDVYRHFLFVYLDELATQLETRKDPSRPFTLAEDYVNYPSQTNREQLQQLFFSINQYFDSKSYTWSRYIDKYKFQLARRNLFVAEWERAVKQYRERLRTKPGTPGERLALDEARRSAEFTYRRLKKEAESNCLPYFSKVNAFYLSDGVSDYLEKVPLEATIEKERRRRGRKKEVVVFVHGLGECRSCWGEFPELLALEDMRTPTLQTYYHVYVFQYATQEKSKGVDNFVRELQGFIDQIKNEEQVRKVSIVGHSFGGVIALRYLVGKDPDSSKPNRESVQRFIGIAPSLHGSHLANLVVGMFRKKEKKFERNLPPFAKGMPFVGKMGDLQVVQNQIGSSVNLASFEVLDRGHVLTPAKGDSIEALTVIGDPWFFTDILLPGGRSEDDELVKTFSANLNHLFLSGPSADKNIGYSGAAVRYTGMTHFRIIEAMDRKHMSYRYVLSFLQGKLLPQENPKRYGIKYFLLVLRVAPKGAKAEERHFLPVEQRSPTGDLILPSLKITTAGWEGAKLHNEEWNKGAGVYYVEGHVPQAGADGRVAVKLEAEGYKTKELALPVKAGQVTYAVELVLDPR